MHLSTTVRTLGAACIVALSLTLLLSSRPAQAEAEATVITNCANDNALRGRRG